MKSRIAILASGSGTTAEACIRASLHQDLNFSAVLILVSRAQAGIFERIKNVNTELGLNIPCLLINHQTHPATPDEVVQKGGQTTAEEQAIIDALAASNCDLIMLMGYMKRVGPKLVQRFGWRTDYRSPCQAMLLNTHPGLLPETKGLYGLLVQQHVVAQHLPYGGQTLHVVAEDYDDGPTIAEHKVVVEPTDTPESLFERVQQAEKQFLPLDIDQFLRARQAYFATNQT